MEDSTLKNNKPHSAEYFDDGRYFWWNKDYIDLVSKRLEIERFKNILDVGCGVGHWGQVLAPFLSDSAKVTGIDREQEWVDTANEKVKAGVTCNRFSYIQGDVMSLPFDNETFDFITCQTVLIHLETPLEALKEMKRVLKPEGLILVSEPNNTASSTISNSILCRLTLEEQILRIKNNLRVQKGKEALREGFNSLGDLVPGYMQKIGFKNIKVAQGDKAFSLIPPYKTDMEQAFIKTKKDWVKRKFTGWHRDDLRRYFIAGGGTEAEYEKYVEMTIQDGKNELSSIEEGSFHSAGGNVCYLISAYK